MTAGMDDSLTIEQPAGYDQIPTPLWLGGACSPGGVIAYTAIRRRANLSAGRRMPTRRQLAEDMGISVGAVDGRLDDLIAGGWLLVTPRLGHGSTGQMSNHYHLLWHPIEHADDPRLLAHRDAVGRFEAAMGSRQEANARARGVSDPSTARRAGRNTRSTGWDPAKAARRQEVAAGIAGRRDSYQAYLAATAPAHTAAGGGAENCEGGVAANCEGGWQQTAPLYSPTDIQNPKTQTPPPAADAAAASTTPPTPPRAQPPTPTTPRRQTKPGAGRGKKTPAPDTPDALPGLEPPTFEDFWATYPRQENWGDARRAWTTAVRRAPAHRIVEAAARYAADPNRPQGQYLPNPGNWLRDQRWNDGPCVPRATGSGAPNRLVASNNASLHLAEQPRGAFLGIEGLQ